MLTNSTKLNKAFVTKSCFVFFGLSFSLDYSFLPLPFTLQCLYNLYILYSIYTLHSLYILYRIYTLYSLYTLYSIYILYSLYTLYSIYTLYSLYTLYSIDTLYNLYILYRIYTLYSVYTLYSIYTLYSQYILYSIYTLYSLCALYYQSPVGLSCRIHRQHLCRGVRPPPHDTKQSDGEIRVMLEFWGMQSTPLLPSHLIVSYL